MKRGLFLALVALAAVAPGLGDRGLWFDEAFTARVASLPLPRLWAAAGQDIHPPGWPLIESVFLNLPMPPEVALRLPSLLAFATLVGVLASRHLLAGVSLLAFEPLMEQASQGRPYAALALGCCAVWLLLDHRRPGLAGVTAGVTASLHAIGLPLVLVVGTAQAVAMRMKPGALLRFTGPLAALSALWLPSWLAQVRAYSNAPWYEPSPMADWLLALDGGAAVFAAAALSLPLESGSVRRLAAPALVGATLFTMEAAGIGLEVRKTGLVLLPLALIAFARPGNTKGWTVATLCLLVGSVTVPTRPDLREAHSKATALAPGAPVLSVFASEAAWYFRTPAPMPSGTSPTDIAGRIQALLTTTEQPCVVSIALPGTAPEDDLLPSGLATRAHLDVAGLDVRVVGTEACTFTDGP